MFEAAGYNPSDYALSWDNRVPIKLVHYNDSKVKKGSRVDRHERPGMGQIGQEEMRTFGDFCYKEQNPYG